MFVSCFSDAKTAEVSRESLFIDCMISHHYIFHVIIEGIFFLSFQTAVAKEENGR